MANATEMLMNEHRVIEKVLGSLETFVKRVDAGVEDERATLRDYVCFFQNFADKCHHGKEEEILFKRMIEKGFPAEYGPVAVMQDEHVEGREHISALAALVEGTKPLTHQERQTVRLHALAFIGLLRDHILKEDLVLYPMAIDALGEAELERLVSQFDDFEAREMMPGRHEKLHALADHLVAAYPPDPIKDPSAPPGPVCCGHR